MDPSWVRLVIGGRGYFFKSLSQHLVRKLHRFASLNCAFLSVTSGFGLHPPSGSCLRTPHSAKHHLPRTQTQIPTSSRTNPAATDGGPLFKEIRDDESWDFKQ